MEPVDLPAVVEIARQAFPDHYEAEERFAERLRADPDLCWVLAGADGDLGGYLIAGACLPGSIPPLDAPPSDTPQDRRTIYLYDLALRADRHGGGWARVAVDLLLERAAAAGALEITLVSVNGSAEFWTRRGFVASAPPDEAKLASYGADARYMTRAIARA